jgi:hypothetical protein
VRAQGTEAVVAAVAGVRSIEKISPVPKAGETEFSFNSRITTSQALMELLQIKQECRRSKIMIISPPGLHCSAMMCDDRQESNA